MDFFFFFNAMCEIYYFDNIIFNPLNSKSFISWPTTRDPLERCTLQRTYIHSSVHIDYPSHVSARNMCIYYKISERCNARAFVSTLESIKPLPRLHEICTFIFLSTTNSNISDKNVIENSKQFLSFYYLSLIYCLFKIIITRWKMMYYRSESLNARLFRDLKNISRCQSNFAPKIDHEKE